MGVKVALDLLRENPAKLSRMQRLKRIKLGSEAAMLLMKVRSSLLSLLERDWRNVVLDNLLPGQRDNADLDVEIEAAPVDEVLDLASDGQLAGRIKVGDVATLTPTGGGD